MKLLICFLLITIPTICMQQEQQNALPVNHHNRRNIDLSGMTKEEVINFVEKTHPNFDPEKRAEIIAKALAKREKDIMAKQTP